MKIYGIISNDHQFDIALFYTIKANTKEDSKKKDIKRDTMVHWDNMHIEQFYGK